MLSFTIIIAKAVFGLASSLRFYWLNAVVKLLVGVLAGYNGNWSIRHFLSIPLNLFDSIAYPELFKHKHKKITT